MKDELIEELRDEFRRGNTIGGLLRMIQDRVGEDYGVMRIADLLQDAFALNPSGWNIAHRCEAIGDGTKPDSFLNVLYLGEIIRKRPQWDTDDGSKEWYKVLKKSSSRELESIAEQRLAQEGFPELSDEGRRKVKMLIEQNLAQTENIAIFAALAEQLQRRIRDLETKQTPALAGAA